MDGRASPEGRRIQTNGARNEKASRLSRAKHNQSKETKKTSRERDRAFIRNPSLSPLSSRPPPHFANHRRRNSKRAGSGRPRRSHSVPSSAEDNIIPRP